MAKIGDICVTCGRVIKSYPTYGNGTCHVCQYEKFINKDISKLKTDIDKFYINRLSQDYSEGSLDYLLMDFIEMLPNMTDSDIAAMQYMLDNIKNR